MKKKLLLVAIASLTALVGCGGTGTETETPATENTEKPTEVVTDKPTEAPVQKGTIRFAKSEYESISKNITWSFRKNFEDGNLLWCS